MNISEFTRNEEANVDIKQHIFETAGLGFAPYKFLGVTENLFTSPGCTPRAGGSCDYCGTSIRYEFHLESANKYQFKVGSDCICKVGDVGLAIHVASHKTKLRRAAAFARRQAKFRGLEALRGTTIAFLQDNETLFKQLPHPYNYINYQTRKPLTWFDYGQWMVNRCGLAMLNNFLREAHKKAGL